MSTKPDPIRAACHTSYQPAARNSGTRTPSTITLIVLHDTEGGSASGIASYFSSPTAEGSAHIVVDDNACYRCLPDGSIPWAAPGANTQGWHIEQCGYASWSKLTWLKHHRTLNRAAYKAAVHCHKFGVPPRFRSAKGLLAGKHGVTTHAEVSKWQTAIHAPGDHSHTDPGANWPRWTFMFLVRRHYKRIKAEKAG
jgi:hypothetical protein